MDGKMKRLYKVMEASNIEIYDVLSILFGDIDLLSKDERKGPVQLHCLECPFRKKCLEMHGGRIVSKQECFDAVETYILDKKPVLPISKELEGRLLKIGFKKQERGYFMIQGDLSWSLIPKASNWMAEFRSPKFHDMKNFQGLGEMQDVFEQIRKDCVRWTERDINWLYDSDRLSKETSSLLKDGNRILKSLEKFRKVWSKEFPVA